MILQVITIAEKMAENLLKKLDFLYYLSRMNSKFLLFEGKSSFDNVTKWIEDVRAERG